MFAHKPVFVIDGERFSTLESFFREFSRVALPTVRWGRNLDAFNDVLRGGFIVGGDDGVVLKWINSDLSRARLGQKETVRQVRKHYWRCFWTDRNEVARQLQSAKHGEGPTVFDWLVEIIRRHGPGGEEAEDGVELFLQ